MEQDLHTARALRVRRMFGQIARTYVLMNRVMTFGMDSAWRKKLIQISAFPRGALILDAGSGTGDISLLALKRDGSLRPVAVDFTLEMMSAGRQRKGADRIRWCCADACRLPFPDSVFDGVVSGYLLRNAVDLRAAVREQLRVIRPGGRLAALDTSPPGRGPLKPFILLYFRFLIPLLGQAVARNRSAYEYLPNSTRAFMEPEKLAALLREEGLRGVKVQKLMFGTQALVSGTKGEE